MKSVRLLLLSDGTKLSSTKYFEFLQASKCFAIENQYVLKFSTLSILQIYFVHRLISVELKQYMCPFKQI
jgi:hypothetical protein